MTTLTPCSTPHGCVVLRGERPLPAPLRAHELAELMTIRRRADLPSSPLFLERRAAILALTRALAYGRPSVPAQERERRSVRALTWNIERGNRLPALLGFLRNHPDAREADVLLLNEVDVGMARSQNRHVAAEIAEALGFEYVFGNSYLCLAHGDARDGVAGTPNAESLHGNAILSRWPILRAENFDVAITKDKFESSEKRLGHKKALWAELDTPGGRLAVVSVHLDPYASPAQRRAQMLDVTSKIEERALGPAVLLGGDLNTTTYDLEALPALAANIAYKMARGGFPHAMDHYMRPQDLYERGVFEALEAAGFDYRSFNDMTAGSVRYEVGTFDSESKVRDHLPGVVAWILRAKLRPWNGVAPLKIDWFAGRGLEPLGPGALVESDGRASLPPRVIQRAQFEGQPISDHDPVLVDVVLSRQP